MEGFSDLNRETRPSSSPGAAAFLQQFRPAVRASTDLPTHRSHSPRTHGTPLPAGPTASRSLQGSHPAGLGCAMGAGVMLPLDWSSCPGQPWQSRGPSAEPTLPLEFPRAPASPGLCCGCRPHAQAGSRLAGCEAPQGEGAHSQNPPPGRAPRRGPWDPHPSPALRPLHGQSHRDARAPSPRCRYRRFFAERVRLAPAPEEPPWPCRRQSCCSPPTPTGTNKTGASPEALCALGNGRPPLSCLLLAVSCSLAGDGVKASNCSKCDQ